MKLSEFYGREMPNIPTPKDLGITVPEGARSPLLFIALWLVIIDEAKEEDGQVVVRVSQRTLSDAAMCCRPTVKKALDFWLKSGAIEAHDEGYRVAVSRQLSGSYVAVSRQLTAISNKSCAEPDSRKSNDSMCAGARLLPEKDTTYLPPPSTSKREGEVQSRAEKSNQTAKEGFGDGEGKTSSLRPLPRAVSEVESWWESASDFDRARFLEKASEGHLSLALLNGEFIRRPEGFKSYRLGTYQKGVGGLTCAMRDYKLALDRADEIRAWRKKREEEANRPPEPPKPTLPDFPLDPPAPSDRDLEEIPVDDWLVGLGPEWEAPYRIVEKAFAGNTMNGALTGWQKKLEAEFAAARANGGVQAHARDIRHIRHRFLDRIRDLRGGLDG